MIKVQINNICAKLTECEPLTSGMIGKTLEVEFSADWNNYEKTAVFSNGDITIDVLESQWSGNTITIPHEVLAVPNRTIVFGMYGFGVENGAVHALPTIYAKIGIPMVGADPESDPTTDPSLPVYAQLQWQIDHFEISDEQIAQQIQEYLETHPIGIEPATATKLGGVKVGDGLSVTADGTLSTEVTATDLDELADTKQDKLIAGQNITIAADGKTISAVGGGESYDDTELRERIATIEGKESTWNAKQDEISDLATIRSGAALGATALQSVPNTYRTASAQDAIDSGFVKLVGAAGQTIQTNVAVPLNVKNNIVLQHRAFVGFHTHDDNAIGFIGVDGGKPTFLAADGVTAKALQSETITDTAGYYATDTVEGALAEIGAELSGINTLVGSGVIV